MVKHPLGRWGVVGRVGSLLEEWRYVYGSGVFVREKGR